MHVNRRPIGKVRGVVTQTYLSTHQRAGIWHICKEESSGCYRLLSVGEEEFSSAIQRKRRKPHCCNKSAKTVHISDL